MRPLILLPPGVPIGLPARAVDPTGGLVAGRGASRPYQRTPRLSLERLPQLVCRGLGCEAWGTSRQLPRQLGRPQQSQFSCVSGTGAIAGTQRLVALQRLLRPRCDASTASLERVSRASGNASADRAERATAALGCPPPERQHASGAAKAGRQHSRVMAARQQWNREQEGGNPSAPHLGNSSAPYEMPTELPPWGRLEPLRTGAMEDRARPPTS